MPLTSVINTLNVIDMVGREDKEEPCEEDNACGINTSYLNLGRFLDGSESLKLGTADKSVESCDEESLKLIFRKIR
jgi:hypothetical protein